MKLCLFFRKGMGNRKNREKRIAKRGKACYNTACVRPKGAAPTLGCRQAVRHQTLTLAFVGSNPAIPAKHDPLAQSAEQLPFKQWVRGSNPRRVTKTLKALGLSGFCHFFLSSPDPLPKPQFLRKAVGLIYGKKANANGSKKLETRGNLSSLCECANGKGRE